MKTILLAALFCLLMSDIARAECAWVLWEKGMRQGQPFECKILEAYPKYDQCKEAQKDWLEQQKKSFEENRKSYQIKTIHAIRFIIILDYEDGSQTVWETQCLPDTIDPRK